MPVTASTISAMCSRSRRCCWKAISRPRARSAAARSAIAMPRPVSANYELPRFLIQNERMSEDLPLGSRGGVAVRHNFPLDAEYVLRIRLQKNGYTYTLGTERERQIDVRIDGQKVKQFTVGGDYNGRRPTQPSSFGQGVYERYLINCRSASRAAVPGEGRLASCPGDVPGQHRRARRHLSAADHGLLLRAQLWPRRRGARGRQSHDRRALKAQRPRRDAEPRAHLRVQARQCRRGRGLRQADRFDADAPRVSSAGHRCGRPGRDELLRVGAQRRRVSRTASKPRCSAFSSIRNSCSASSAIRRKRRRARPIASAISSWRRACRSSSGAASRTMSFSISPRAAS